MELLLNFENKTEEELRSMFEPYGNVEGATLVTDLVHLLHGIGRRRTLRADGPKNDGGCTVDNGETFGQQAGISVIKLAVGKIAACLK